jgi:hypothetical protein
MKQIRLALAIAVLGMIPMGASAIDLDESGSFSMTGFYSLTGAKVLSGSAMGSSDAWTYQQFKCPCAIQNWEYVGVYEQDKGFQFDQESLVGVQFRKEFTPSLSLVAQLVARAKNPNYNSSPTVDWAYASYSPVDAPEWTVQAGRQRIPLYYYSDYLYIGYSYPWVRPAPDVYGWPIYAYDGANVSYQTQLGKSNWSASTKIWAGGFTQNNDAYDTLIYYTTPTSHSWSNIVGASLSLTNGPFDVRAMVMTYKDSYWQDGADGAKNYLIQDQPTRIMGLSANLDYKNWVIRTEVDRFEQTSLNFIYNYALLGVGYSIGDFTPMITRSQYTTAAEPIEARQTTMLSLRWNFRKDTALKLQYDISTDRSHYSYPFFGDSKLLSISLQGTF